MIEAFILAGGKSSRFGSPKSLMQIDGCPVLETISAVLHNALPDSDVAIVMADGEQPVPALPELPVIFDLYPGRGPLGGLHAALAYAKSDWVLVTACDLPFLSAELIARLVSKTSDEYGAIVPVQEDGRYQPLCSLYRRKACLPVIEEMVLSKSPTPSMRSIFDRLATRRVTFDELSELPGSESFFTNINTVSDIERL